MKIKRLQQLVGEELFCVTISEAQVSGSRAQKSKKQTQDFQLDRGGLGDKISAKRLQTSRVTLQQSVDRSHCQRFPNKASVNRVRPHTQAKQKSTLICQESSQEHSR